MRPVHHVTVSLGDSTLKVEVQRFVKSIVIFAVCQVRVWLSCCL